MKNFLVFSVENNYSGSFTLCLNLRIKHSCKLNPFSFEKIKVFPEPAANERCYLPKSNKCLRYANARIPFQPHKEMNRHQQII